MFLQGGLRFKFDWVVAQQRLPSWFCLGEVQLPLCSHCPLSLRHRDLISCLPRWPKMNPRTEVRNESERPQGRHFGSLKSAHSALLLVSAGCWCEVRREKWPRTHTGSSSTWPGITAIALLPLLLMPTWLSRSCCSVRVTLTLLPQNQEVTHVTLVKLIMMGSTTCHMVWETWSLLDQTRRCCDPLTVGWNCPKAAHFSEWERAGPTWPSPAWPRVSASLQLLVYPPYAQCLKTQTVSNLWPVTRHCWLCRVI